MLTTQDPLVLRNAAQWRAEGHRVVLGTITRTWGSAPRPIGSHVAVRDDGRVAGSVSGGCIEDDLVARIREGSLALARPERVRYGVSAEEATRFGLPCGGTLELVLEPLGEHSAIEALLDRLDQGVRTRRTFALRPCTVMPVSRCSRWTATSSAPTTPMMKGPSPFMAGGHSTYDANRKRYAAFTASLENGAAAACHVTRTQAIHASTCLSSRRRWSTSGGNSGLSRLFL